VFDAVKRLIILGGSLTVRQMYELALQYMQWQHQTEGVGLSETPV